MSRETGITYDIVMNTPIGSRMGQITVLRSAGSDRGHLDILKHSEPFEGVIDEQGNCVLTGHLVTLMRTISYEAAGTITDDALTLSLKDGYNVLKITGAVHHR